MNQAFLIAIKRNTYKNNYNNNISGLKKNKEVSKNTTNILGGNAWKRIFNYCGLRRKGQSRKPLQRSVE